ncbi:hypothetical protein NC652_002622 [Populus alba x Populus x berolinensis]|nr:hypothetical protein NC652_002622 [Populus alba x Populus x berolinensis]
MACEQPVRCFTYAVEVRTHSTVKNIGMLTSYWPSRRAFHGGLLWSYVTYFSCEPPELVSPAIHCTQRMVFLTELDLSNRSRG